MLNSAEKAVSIPAPRLALRHPLLPLPFALPFRAHLFLGLFDRARQPSTAALERFFQASCFAFRLFQGVELVALVFERFLNEFVLHVFLVAEGQALAYDLRVLRIDVQRLRHASFPLLQLP